MLTEVAPNLRQKLEEELRQCLDRSLQRYRLAVARYRKAVDEQQSGLAPPPDGAFAVRVALIEGSAARDKYVENLSRFSDLLLHGKMPQDHD
jgi:hypothetical protein